MPSNNSPSSPLSDSSTLHEYEDYEFIPTELSTAPSSLILTETADVENRSNFEGDTEEESSYDAEDDEDYEGEEDLWDSDEETRAWKKAHYQFYHPEARSRSASLEIPGPRPIRKRKEPSGDEESSGSESSEAELSSCGVCTTLGKRRRLMAESGDDSAKSRLQREFAWAKRYERLYKKYTKLRKQSEKYKTMRIRVEKVVDSLNSQLPSHPVASCKCCKGKNKVDSC